VSTQYLAGAHVGDPRQEEPAPPAGEDLLSRQETTTLTQRWQDIQVGFVDEPRESVQAADALVAELMQKLTLMFTQERRQLDARWNEGGDVSTEDLRRILQRYRSFFRRLLTAHGD
jgi:hypothetical protein